MAQTYTYADALNIVDKVIARNVTDDLAAYLCEVATNVIWGRYDWRESIAQLPPFYMIPLEQDHGPPTTVVPSDFWGLREVYWVRPSTMPPHREPLTVFRDLPLTHTRYLPHAISYQTTKKAFRLFPRVPESCTATEYVIDGTYKKRFTKITADALQTLTLPWDDMGLDTYVQALKWAAWDYFADPRAGEDKVEAGNIVHTGQKARMLDALDHKAMMEGLQLGDVAIAPSEALANPSAIYQGAILGFGL